MPVAASTRKRPARRAPAPVLGAREVFRAHPRQQELWRAIKSLQYQYIAFGGAVGGGKSYAAVQAVLDLCQQFPGSRWGIVRKSLKTIRKNLLPTFRKLRAPIADKVGDVNMQSWSARCANGSEILFISENFDQDKDLNHFDGLEVNGFVLEEAAELNVATWHKCIQRAGRWDVPGLKMQPPVLIIVTCNPTQNWVKRVFYAPYAAGELKAPYLYIPSKVTDNPDLSKAYLESLKQLPPELYRQFVEGDWNVADDPHAIIPYQHLHACIERDPAALAAAEGEEALGIDVGELGTDKTVCAYMRGETCYEITGWRGEMTGGSSDLIIPTVITRGVAPARVGVDAVGVGAGVYSDLVRSVGPVHRIAFGAAPTERSVDGMDGLKLEFANLKAQMWWKLREDVLAGEIRIPDDETLIQDLLAVRYFVRGERKIAVETKDELRKRIGRSTDFADALVIANFVRGLVTIPAFEFTPDAASDPLADAGGLTESLYDY